MNKPSLRLPSPPALLRRLWRSRRGSVTITFLLTSTLMLGGAVGAIDLARYNAAQMRVVNALDAAAISAGRNLGNYTPVDGVITEAQWVDDARAFFRANMPERYLGADVSVEDLDIEYTELRSSDARYLVGQKIAMNVSGELPLISTGYLGYTSMRLGASNEALRRNRSDLEVVLVLDNTGSMAERDGTSRPRMQHLQSASNLLVDLILGAAQANENSRTFIGLVPFTHVINIGNYSHTRSWLTSDWQNSLFVRNGLWNGCITEPRPGGRPPARIDAAGTGPGNFRPLVATGPIVIPVLGRSSRDGSSPANVSTSADIVSGSPTLTTRNAAHMGYAVPADPRNPTRNFIQPSVVRVSTGWFGSEDRLSTLFQINPQYCGATRETMFLTQDANRIRLALNRMTSEGGTLIPTGLLWGWRMLHPGWQGRWGSQTVTLENGAVEAMPRRPHRDLTKVIILLTDGENSPGGNSTSSENFEFTLNYDYTTGSGWFQRRGSASLTQTSYGDIVNPIQRHNALNDQTADLVPSGGSSTAGLDSYTRSLCANIKNPDDPAIPGGIKLYTVALGSASNSSVQALMRDCASSNGYYDSTNVNDLSLAFASIAGDLMELRLTK